MFRSEELMKCVFISCFNAYNNRIAYLEEIFNSKGYECTYITSNFDHGKKDFFTSETSNTIQIDVMPYKKNLSFARLFSHILFSRAALKEVGRIKPDILYAMLPPNSLAYFSAKYKKKNNVKVIFDIFDLWPETFPSNRYKRVLGFIFNLWKNLRNSNLNHADFIVTECRLFQKKIEQYIDRTKSIILYPTTKESLLEVAYDNDSEYINLCYLGSINNIIDIEGISNLLSDINKIRAVRLHVIGDGEKRMELIETVQNQGVEVIYHGRIYEADKKQQIFNKCCFGINMMKDSVCVGLTLKSIDYMQAGLPLLNNIKSDTLELVQAHHIGLNVEQDTKITAEMVAGLTYEQIVQFKENTKKLYQELFSINATKSKIEELCRTI